MARETTRIALLNALDRLLAGRAKRSTGALTAATLAEEAGVGRASLYRCPDILKALETAKLNRGNINRAAAPLPIPMTSSERDLRDAVKKLANRILLLEKMLDQRDTEIARLRQLSLMQPTNVVPFVKHDDE